MRISFFFLFFFFFGFSNSIFYFIFCSTKHEEDPQKWSCGCRCCMRFVFPTIHNKSGEGLGSAVWWINLSFNARFFLSLLLMSYHLSLLPIHLIFLHSPSSFFSSLVLLPFCPPHRFSPCLASPFVSVPSSFFTRFLLSLLALLSLSSLSFHSLSLALRFLPSLSLSNLAPRPFCRSFFFLSCDVPLLCCLAFSMPVPFSLPPNFLSIPTLSHIFLEKILPQMKEKRNEGGWSSVTFSENHNTKMRKKQTEKQCLFFLSLPKAPESR